MAHEITIRTNGFAEMASRSQEWHSADTHHQIISDDDSIEDIEHKAGMNWKLQRAKVRFATGHGQGAADWSTMDDQHVILRSDTHAPLGIVSDKFKIVQPRQVLEFFRELTDSAGFKIETAGTLFGGRKFWCLASIGDTCEIVPGDKVGGYLGIATACDGSMATTGQFSAVRWVCNNTISMSLAQGSTHKISHRTTFSPEAMRSKLGIAHQMFGDFAKQSAKLADKQVSKDRAERLLLSLLAPQLEAVKAPTLEQIEKVTESAAFTKILALFNGDGRGARMDGVKGTGWGWLNACTEYADHWVRATSDENRMHSAWFGPGADLKARALELVTAL
jgi:phage/plasmid-like protein (TIGR03299 family)